MAAKGQGRNDFWDDSFFGAARGQLLGLVAKRVKEWIRELIDVSKRNNLLYFRETKSQHIDLSQANEEARKSLIEGNEVTFEQLFPFEEQAPGFVNDALSRVKSIVSKAKENFEERSIDTLHLAVWECSWDDSKRSTARQGASGSERIPRAPLFLAPIEIRKGSKQGGYRFQVVGGWEINRALKFLMKTEFDIDLDISTDQDENVELGFHEELCRRIGQAPGGNVEFSAQVSNFSYAKLAMVEDLQEGETDLIMNQMILAICGDQDALSAVRGNLVDPPLDLPNRIEPMNEFLILDADSSQNQVINAILDGQSFAFDGPPGTGKSQTIANAISALVADGKRVLFVAEKRAAIEAVVKRLGDRGLSELVMDYHGTGKKKKQVIADLRSTYDVVRSTSSRASKAEVIGLKRERGRLVEHSHELHEKRSPFGLSLYELMVLAAKHEAGSSVRFRFPFKVRSHMTFQDIETCESLLRRLWDLGGFVIDEGLVEWRNLNDLDIDVVEADLGDLGDLIDESIPSIQEAFDNVALELSSKELTFSDKEIVAKLAVDIFRFQELYGVSIFHEKLSDLTLDLQKASSFFGRLFGPILSAKYRRAKKRVRTLVGRKAKSIQLLSIATQAKDLEGRWITLNGLGISREVLDLRLLTSVAELPPAIEMLAKARSRFEKFEKLSTEFEVNLEQAAMAATELLRVANYARTAQDALEVEAELEKFQMSKFLEEIKSNQDDLPLLMDMLWYSWSTSIVESVGTRVLGMTATASDSLVQSSVAFRELDMKHIEDTPARIRAIWAQRFENSLSEFEDEWHLLSAAFNRKRGLPGIRTVFDKSKNVVSALKPCWVMSPLSVSMLRPPVGWFDVVIFDEASQVLPADAMTSIKAARQVVVAGDDKQLPPTTFFASGEDGEEEIIDDIDDESVKVGHYESILSLMKYIITKPRQLRWHYRSRDERLIHFSNEKLYRSLITFPDSAEGSCLTFVKVENGPSAVSVRASNLAEVQEVVELIREHASVRPEESLGVIALGTPHANAIEDALWAAAHEDSDLASFLESHQEEPFFVKNLERVQGDERDAIILTIGYGRNSRGEILYNFGPINGRFGERRLNVAVTRAKNRMTLVSTFSHVELDEKKCKSGGLPFLRDYIKYVESGGVEFGDTSAVRPEMNAFEYSIYSRLNSAGFQVVPQYGVGNYRIDFAVVHPDDPSRFVLAIECDGASYHSLPTARERDRLRQDALERRGWRVHRIWSTDWFVDPDGELERCIAAIVDNYDHFGEIPSP